jgi:hypothetical protein
MQETNSITSFVGSSRQKWNEISSQNLRKQPTSIYTDNKIFITTKGFVKHQQTQIRAKIAHGISNTDIEGSINNDPYQSSFTADAFSLLAAVHHASQITEVAVKTLHVCVHNPSLARHINNRAAKNLRDRNVMSSEWDIIEHIYDIVTTFSEFNITSHHQTSDDVL